MAPTKDGFPRPRSEPMSGRVDPDRTIIGVLYIKNGKAMIDSTVIGDMSNPTRVSKKIVTEIAKTLLRK